MTDNSDTINNVKPQLTAMVELFQWLLVALILTLFFRAFIMEAYRIPTGSMANTLKGAHFRFCCPQCGYDFDRGYESEEYNQAMWTIPPSGKIKPRDCRCPNCGYDIQFDKDQWVASGDRILVLKCIYQFFEPKRWDVVVFKNPSMPESNMIKRLVAKPGETVQVIDGDIYINGIIARKPKKLQSKLWMPVFNADYLPVNTDGKLFNRHKWMYPWQNEQGSDWHRNTLDNTSFILDSNSIQIHRLDYDTKFGNGFRASYAYNSSNLIEFRPYCSDLKVQFYVSADQQSFVGAELSKYGIKYRGWLEQGTVYLAKSDSNGIELMKSKSLLDNSKTSGNMSFALVDHQLILTFAGTTVNYDLGSGPDDAGIRNTQIEPEVNILGRGKVRISHLAIYRDIHYTVRYFNGSKELSRAAEDNAFTLKPDEFFVLGDNSPNSDDGRWWNKNGFGNNGSIYRKGIVPREYLMGKAVLVYWPSGYRPFDKFRPAVIPNLKQIRFIYGGSGNVIDD